MNLHYLVDSAVPKKPECSYVVRIDGQLKAFIADPIRFDGRTTRWILTHPCVLAVSCEQCGAKLGEPCRGRKANYTADTHWIRREAYSDFKKSPLVKDLIETATPAARILHSLLVYLVDKDHDGSEDQAEDEDVGGSEDRDPAVDRHDA